MEFDLLLVSNVEAFRDLKDAWEALLRSSKHSSYFASWHWLFTWWEVFNEPCMELRIYCVYRADSLVAILPLYAGYSRKFNLLKYHWLRFLGTGENENEEVSTEYSDIICKAGLEEEVEDYFRECLANERICWDKLILERILDSSLVFKMVRDSTDNFRFRESLSGLRYYSDISSGFESYKATLAKHFRKHLEYCVRRIERTGTFAFTTTIDPDCIANDLESLRLLHTKRWLSKGLPGAFTSDRFIRFHEAQMRNLLKRGDLFLMKISSEDKAIAILYGIRDRNVFYFYQSGFEPDVFKSFSLGHVNIIKAIEAAATSGCRYFDFMMGSPQSYKQKYNCLTEEMYNLRVYNKGRRSRWLFRMSGLSECLHALINSPRTKTIPGTG